MITYWQQQADGKLAKVTEEEIDKEARVWVDARVVTRDDVELLQNQYKIDPDHILDVLDPDELSRLEDGEGYVLAILRLPIFEPSAETPYFTTPLGIIIKDNFIITVCWTDCEVLRDFTAGRVKGIQLTDFPAFIMRIIGRANVTYLRYLKEINRRSSAIQNELQLSIENKEIIQLLSLEKSLVYFTTSLKSNQLLLEKFHKTKLIKLDYDDMDWLDDVEIDNKQAIEMADTYRNVLIGVTDAFDSVISNNLNVYMKRLSILNILMMVPTFITSYFGMNIDLPFVKFGKGANWLIGAVCIVSVFVTNFILLVYENKYPKKEKTPKKTITQRRKERKALRRLKQIEEALED